MSNYVHVKLAPTNWLGLAFLSGFTVMLGTALFVCAMIVMHPTAKVASNDNLPLPNYSQIIPYRAFENEATALPRVNSAALNEIKQQQCIPCRQPQVRYPSQVYYPSPVVNPVVVTPSQPVSPIATPSQPTPVNVPGARAVPVTQKCVIALFLDNSPRAKQLEQWFTTDPQLVALRRNVSFEVYTPDNALYRTRYASIVPVHQFPVVLFMHSDGAHIHAAGSNVIPSTPAELYSDLQVGYEKSKSVRSATIPADGAVIRTKTYSFDETIHPSMQLQIQDPRCPDGICPTDDPWRPGDNVRDLFNSAKDAKNVVLWAGAAEIVTYVLVGLVAVLALLVAVVLVMKLGK